MYGDISAKAAQMLSLPKVPLTKYIFCMLLIEFDRILCCLVTVKTAGPTYYIPVVLFFNWKLCIIYSS